MTLKFEEIPKLTTAERMDKLNQLADEMASQIGGHLYSSLNETLEKAGQVVDGKGKPFDIETFFVGLESIQMEFDKDGKHNLSFAIPPELGPRVKAVLEQAESDPATRKRHDELMARKWMEWRDREATRKLVG